jgi:hypothetical protein
VEDVLFTHPDVSNAAVVGIPDPEWGESVAAFVQLKDGRTLLEAELAAFAGSVWPPLRCPASGGRWTAFPRPLPAKSRNSCFAKRAVYERRLRSESRTCPAVFCCPPISARLFAVPVAEVELACHSVLSRTDLDLIRPKRRASNQLGFAVDFPPRSGGLRSERHAAMPVLTSLISASAWTGVQRSALVAD